MTPENPASTPQPREARRGPNCSTCRVPKIRIMVVTGCERFADPDYGVAVCPTCDCVEIPRGFTSSFSGRRVTAPLVPIWRGNLR